MGNRPDLPTCTQLKEAFLAHEQASAVVKARSSGRLATLMESRFGIDAQGVGLALDDRYKCRRKPRATSGGK